MLDQSGNTISGYVTGHENQAAWLVFTLTVNTATGDVTLTQDRAVHENTASSPDTGEGISLTGGLVTLTATVTDKDGDSAAQNLDLSSHVTFHDDGPSIALSGRVGSLNTYEAYLSASTNAGINGSTPDAVPTQGHTLDKESFAGAFTVVTGADNATTAYALSIAANGTATNLIDSASGLGVVLDQSGNTISGYVTGHENQAAWLVFTLTVNTATGDVTLTQDRAVHENTASSPDTGEGISLTGGLVTLTATVTDKDGDSAAQNLDLSSHVTFHDDGPSIGLSGNVNSLNTYEAYLSASTNAGNNGSTPDAVPTQGHALDKESFAGAFTVVTGADNATTAYALSIAGNGTATNLIDSASGLGVVLDQSGSTISGYVTGHENQAAWLVFTLTVNPATGDVTLTQDRAVHENTASSPDTGEGISLTGGLVTLTATVTDKDGDSASQNLDLSTHVTFHDDGPKAPTLTVSGAVGVDETPGVQTVSGASDVLGSTAITFNGAANTVAGLFATVANAGTDTDVSSAVLDNGALSFASTGASNILTLTGGGYGADGPGSTTYALSVLNAASGLTLTDGTAITLSLDGSGRIIGTVGADAANPSLTGKVAFAIAIDPATGQVYVAEYLSLHQPDTTNPNDSISLVAGKIGATVTVTDADGDHVSASADIGTHIGFLDDGPTLGAFVNGTLPNDIGSVNGTFAVNFGADGFGGFTLTGPTISGITYSTVNLTDAGGHVIGSELIGSAGATQVFDLKVYEDGTYTFDLLHPAASTTVTDSLTNLSSGHSTWKELADGSIEFFSAGEVNTSVQGLGVGNNFLDAGETFNMEFHVPGTGIGTNDSPNTNPQFVDSVNFTVNSASPGDSVFWTATDSVHGTTQSGVAFVDASGTHLLIDPTISFNELDITGGPGIKMRLTAADIGKTVLPSDQNLSFGIVATDGDGDHTTSSTLGVHVVASDSSGNFTLTGGGTADVIATSSHTDTVVGGGGTDIVDYRDDTTGVTVNLQTGHGSGGTAAGDTYSGIEGILGGSGNDTLTGLAAGGNYLDGGPGNDTLNGGAGNDTFVLQLNGGGHDTINNFNALSDQIFVNLGDNLSIGQASTVAAANFHTGDETNAATWNGGTGKEFVFNATTHELWYSANGTGSDKVDLAHVSTGVPAAANVHVY
ncbi:hypothetical protein BRSPCE3_05900 [Bradyrhizobium sp. Ce-3]|nr:hypothetical protein BRSPCE3_05900 [Bradyrhizobium sp. Ce-3]